MAETNNARLPDAHGRRTAYTTSWGLLIGAGLEQAIAPAWTLKFEYDYLRTGDFGFSVPPSQNVFVDGTWDDVAGRATHAQLNNNLFKVGLNYRFGENALAQWGSSGAIKPFQIAGWSVEPILRYWHSTGRFQKDLASIYFSERRLISRLTYDGLTANTNEIGARLDSPWLVFLKGYYGAGSIIGGHMNDEDWIYAFAQMTDRPSSATATRYRSCATAASATTPSMAASTSSTVPTTASVVLPATPHLRELRGDDLPLDLVDHVRRRATRLQGLHHRDG